MLRSVDLPQPDGPITLTKEASFSVMLRSLKMTVEFEANMRLLR